MNQSGHRVSLEQLIVPQLSDECAHYFLSFGIPPPRFPFLTSLACSYREGCNVLLGTFPLSPVLSLAYSKDHI